MKTALFAALLVATLNGSDALGQATDKPSSGSLTPATPKPSPEELESRFKETMTRATMSGRWALIQDDGTLAPEKEDKYTIMGVSKVGGNAWLIHARIQYGKKDVVAPIPVQIEWAGDTPVIIVDKIPIPSGGVYSARVLIYDKTYAGTWSGGDHKGLLSGTITNAKEQ